MLLLILKMGTSRSNISANVDGEKFVVDIVTRDLRNNGPIRKSMRGDRNGYLSDDAIAPVTAFELKLRLFLLQELSK